MGKIFEAVKESIQIKTTTKHLRTNETIIMRAIILEKK